MSSVFSTMIAAQLCHLDKTAAKGLSLEFILHDYARALDFAAERDLKSLFLSLDKLCIYCEALIQSSLEKKGGDELFDALDELRTTCCRTMRTLARDKKALPSPSFEGLQTVFVLLEKHFLSQAKDSETALFALLEVRNTLNAHLGPSTVENFLEKLFPEGPEALREVLREGFGRRGFYGFCEERSKVFEGLKWGNSTPNPPFLP